MRKTILSFIALLVVAVTLFAQNKEWSNITPRQKLVAVEAAVARYYMDTVDESKLVDDAIRGLLEGLDPHSTYSDKEETKELTEPLDGNFSGIGIEFNMQKDTLFVVSTIAGGPSERVGVRAGDRIVRVNDTIIAGVKMKQKDIMKRLRGVKGTNVEISVVRRGVAEPILFKITRDEIPLYSIDAYYMVDKTTGYIRLSRFSRTSYDEFMDATKQLKKKGMQQLILDLTDNGGGYLDVATSLANEFLEKDQLIVYTEGKSQPRREMKARGDGKFKDMKVVVMVNQFSASASEILSGALQDWDRGVVVGRRTFGKGLVQHPIPFPDGTMMRLSIARYYTPSGRCIQKPYNSGDRDEYNRDILDRYNHGELYSADSTKFDEKLKYKTLKVGRTVYGGGGVMPDIFVPLDTMAYSKYYRDLSAKGVINSFAVSFVDKHRAEIKGQYPTEDDYIAGFAPSEDLMLELIEAGKAEKVEFVEADYARSKELLQTILKAIIGRDIYERTTFYRIINPATSEIYRNAVEVINSPDFAQNLQSK